MRLPELGALLALVGTAHTCVNVRLLRTPAAPPAPDTLSVIVPARDETHQLAACLASLPAAAEVVVVDDGSRDGTAEQVPAGVRLVRGTPPPAGWLGKPWACAQGAAVATGDVLVFVDADVRLLPGDGLARAAALLRTHGLALVSPYPRLLAGSPLERLLQPLLPWSWLTLLPLRGAEHSTRPSLAAAGGQLLVVDAAAYRAVGGHGAVRGRVVEDVALLQALQRKDFRGVIVDGTDIAHCRMYVGTRPLLDGWTKTLAALPPPAALAVAAVLTTAYVAPWCGRSRLARLGALAGVAGRVLTARRTGGRPADALLHPVSVLAADAVLALAWWRRLRGTVRWKGRAV